MITAWVSISINQPPKWEGQTADGKLVTDFKSIKTAPKNWWGGYLYTKHEDIVITEVTIEKNGDLYFQNENIGTLTKNKPLQYVEHVGSWENREDEYVMIIQWIDDEGAKEEVIQLEPKTRYFVLPRPGFGEWGWNEKEQFN